MQFSIAKKLGLRIKEIRESKNIRQVELAELIGMEPANLSKVESGNPFPKGENLEKIAHCLDVDISGLFEFEHKRNLENLRVEIEKMLDSFTLSEMEFTYKMLTSVKLLKNRNKKNL